MRGELQYIQDSLLIEKIAAYEFKITKQAGVTDILGGVADAIKNEVKGSIQGDSAKDIALGVGNLLAPAMLFRLHPIVGILYMIGEAFGFNFSEVVKKISDVITGKIINGEKLTPEIVNNIGKSIIGEEAGPIESKASNDMLDYLKSINIDQYLTKQADKSSIWGGIKEMVNMGPNNGSNTVPKVPYFFAEKNSSPLQRIFGELFRTKRTGKAKWLLGGFVVWIIKTVLAGAGLLALSHTVKDKITDGTKNILPEIKENKEIKQDPQNHQEHKEEVKTNISNKPKLEASGRGENKFLNDANNLWIVPLVKRSIAETLWTWAKDIYPNIDSYKSEFFSSPAFNKIHNLMNQNYKSSSPSKLVMPKGFHSVKEMIDSIVSDLN